MNVSVSFAYGTHITEIVTGKTCSQARENRKNREFKLYKLNESSTSSGEKM